MNTNALKEVFNLKKIINTQTLTALCLSWAVMSLLFFLLFSVKAPESEYPTWYSLGTYIFEAGGFLGATILCLRNWLSPQIASGRKVWLGFALGMFAYFLGDIVYGLWELVWGLSPDVSLADFLFVLSYVCIGFGMVLAVLPRKLNLELWQWLVVGFTAAIGAALVFVVLNFAPEEAEGVTETAVTSAPQWVTAIDSSLSGFEVIFGYLYIFGDLALLFVAALMLMAFWGGKFSKSWTWISLATVALYIADMWVKVAITISPNYVSGGLAEVGFVWCAVLFGVGAVWEFDISSRPSRGRRRRGGAS